MKQSSLNLLDAELSIRIKRLSILEECFVLPTSSTATVTTARTDQGDKVLTSKVMAQQPQPPAQPVVSWNAVGQHLVGMASSIEAMSSCVATMSSCVATMSSCVATMSSCVATMGQNLMGLSNCISDVHDSHQQLVQRVNTLDESQRLMEVCGYVDIARFCIVQHIRSALPNVGTWEQLMHMVRENPNNQQLIDDAALMLFGMDVAEWRMVSRDLHGVRNVRAHPSLAYANEQETLILIDQLPAVVSMGQRAALRKLIQALFQLQLTAPNWPLV